MIPSDYSWPEDPLPVPSTPIRPASSWRDWNPHAAPRLADPFKAAPRAPEPAPDKRPWTENDTHQAVLLVRRVATRKCRCTRRTRQCDPCRARAITERMR